MIRRREFIAGLGSAADEQENPPLPRTREIAVTFNRELAGRH
jgi:hypothetical protein